AAAATSGNSNNAKVEKASTRGSGAGTGGKSRGAAEVEEARRFVWRQRVRALRHADYMRIETLHYLKLVATAIPRLRLVWRGEDFCGWEGVTCTALRYPIEALVDMPAVLPKRPARDSGVSRSGVDG
ncbi:hypothetical protein DQ04_26961000, partial [Trypanosoma grayi]|uniref:hypothetical protein n=1 Tax=Trypanosoma grayi TaxID=71804 RepID=UPI0004F4A179